MVENFNVEEGVNVTVLPSVLNENVPPIFAVPSFTVNVELVTDVGLIFSLNVPLTVDPTTTPVAPLVGIVLVTVGLTVSIVTMIALEAGLVLPAALRAFAVKV